MKSLFIVLLAVSLGTLSCQTEKDEMMETWLVNSAKVDCTGAGPMKCLQIQKGTEIEPAEWQSFYDSIEGFEYVPGNIYQIKVKVIDREEPVPADASSKKYELVEVLSDEPDPSLRLTNIWKVLKVGNIENPTDNKSGEALAFEFDASAKTYFGNAGCNNIRGAIKENDGEQLLLGSGMSTMMACPAMDAENAIKKALEDTRSYQIESNTLILKDSTGTALITFQAID